ncbi:MAG TPA: T9SS type A sorting domain-containing protein [Bacteroidia bacterium]|nr:T9SS type A sorting domain-containing protein [Bacteroidia bacterium]
MKKQLLFASALLIGGSSLWAQSQRLVLVEEYTQASCGPCASANPTLNALLDANIAKATSIKYQVSWPGSDPMYNQNKTDVNTRVSYYGVASVGVPYAVMDGVTVTGGGYTGAPGGLNQTKIDAANAISSPFDMQLTYWFNAANDSIFINCQVKATQAVTLTTPKLQVAMIEKLITFTSAPGSNGEKKFEHVMRKMYPDAAGTTIPTSWTNGQTQSFSYKAAIPTYIYKKTEIATVAWIQDNSNKKVQQAAFSPTPLITNISNINHENILMNIYPNPSNGLFTASFNAINKDNYTIMISNSLGQVVYKENLNNFTGIYLKQMDISSFGQGVYLFSISSSDGQQMKQVINY